MLAHRSYAHFYLFIRCLIHAHDKAHVLHLYQNYRNVIKSQEQEVARKSMAATSISNASSLYDNTDLRLLSMSSLSSQPQGMHGNAQNERAKNDITITATWLEKAETLLSTKSENNQVQKEIEDEMRQISNLITEAPKLLSMSNMSHKIKSNNGLNPPDPRILSHPGTKKGCGEKSDPTSIERNENNPMKLLASISSQATPVQTNVNKDSKPIVASTRTKEAKLLVNFLQSVAEPY